MNSINQTIKSFAINSNLSESMILRIDLILTLFDEILIASDYKMYSKILSSLDKIFSHHLKDASLIKDFDYYFKNYNDNEIKKILRFLSCYFHLLNQCEIEEINFRNKLKSQKSDLKQPLKDSIFDAIKFLSEKKITFHDAKNIVESILFEPTLTSHPTEFRRISLLTKQNQILKNINEYLFNNNHQDIKSNLRNKIKKQIYIFMNTDDHRSINISPKDEIKNSIFLMFNSVWESIPHIYDDMRSAFKTYYNKEYHFTKNINFCTWIGGDRDGNPNITSDITEWTLKFQRTQILKKYIKSIETLFYELSLSTKSDLEFENSIQKDLKKIDINNNESKFQNESIRLKLLLIKSKLEQTLNKFKCDEIITDYSYLDFKKDLITLKNHLNNNFQIELYKNSSLENLIIQAETFQFYLLQLDIRQHSDCHADFIKDMLGLDYKKFKENKKQETLIRLIKENKKIINLNKLNYSSIELYNTFKVIINNLNHHPNSIKSYIVSMTHETSDILEVLLIFNQVKLDLKIKKDLFLNIIPLYETIHDLKNAEVLIDNLLNNKIYKSHLEKVANYQEVMLGYSDSNKDGGIFMANYSIQSCIREINKVFNKYKIDYSIFHGRGGSISRGGGKSNEAIRSLPSTSNYHKLRMTEQGEIISYRYGNSEISKRHLEQIISALIKSSVNKSKDDFKFEELSFIAKSTYNNYKKNIINLDYWKFFIKTTPINFISKLKISSRPYSRNKIRFNQMGFDEIRAIPWVSAWVQTRYNVSGWYGIGTKLNDLIKSDNLKLLQNLYKKSSFFKNMMDNITFEMARARIPISKKYSEIHHFEKINKIIEKEFELIFKSYLLMTKNDSLLSRNRVIENLITFRNPTTDLLNLIQIEYMKRIINNSKKKKSNSEIIISSINGIAAAMQTTG